MWLWYLGLAWLELHVLWDFLWHTKIPLIPLINFFGIEGSVEKGGWIRYVTT